MLRVENVTTRILQGISFRVPEGRCVAIAGPSGSGKTTMLNTIAGALPYQGTIYLPDSALTTCRHGKGRAAISTSVFTFFLT